MTSARSRKSTKSFVDRVLDGDTRIDAFAAEVRAWQAGDQKQPLHDALGLDADELLLVARSPDALRYLLHARRFASHVPDAALDSQARVDAYAMQLASASTDLYLLAEIEEWRSRVQAPASSATTRTTSHA